MCNVATRGAVILLNGTSSSGKTTIAKALQAALPEPYLHMSIDGFVHQLPDSVLDRQEALIEEMPRLLAGFHAATAATAFAGCNLIVDHVLEDPSWLDACVAAFGDLKVAFVGVMCPLAELERREAARGDRLRGLARYQHDRVHSHGIYDLKVDTSVMSVEECVRAICGYLELGSRPNAFERLRHVKLPCEQAHAADADPQRG